MWRVWITQYGRSEWKLIEADDFDAAVVKARKKWRHKYVGVVTTPVPSKAA